MSRALQVQDIEQAALLFHKKLELGCPEIQAIFNCSRSKAEKLKRIAREKAIEDNVRRIDLRNVPTKTAFEAWGIDIDDLEKRIDKLNELRRIIAKGHQYPSEKEV